MRKRGSSNLYWTGWRACDEMHFLVFGRYSRTMGGKGVGGMCDDRLYPSVNCLKRWRT